MSAPNIHRTSTVRFDTTDSNETKKQTDSEIANKLKRKNDRKYGLPYREILQNPIKNTLSLDSSLKFLATINPKYTENIKIVRKNKK